MDIHFDFTFFLTAATLFTGVVWLIDKFLFEKKRQTADVEIVKDPAVVDFSKSFFPVLALVLVIRSFIAEPFRIPSGSMIPTLLVGDFIVVTKYSYGLKVPVLETKFIEVGEPERGDVIVFRYPEDPSIDFIKRVVGVPGDSVVYKDNRLFVNQKAVDISKVGDFNYTDIYGKYNHAIEMKEYLPGRSHLILNHKSARSVDGVELNIPEGHYFVLGDNRDRSKDSRFWGLVSEKHLVGKAQFIWMHWGFENLDRIGTKIQ